MYGEPNWLASYLAKKITRLAFSVYRSNICPSPRCPQSPLPKTSLSLPVASRASPGRSLPVRQAPPSQEVQHATPDKPAVCQNRRQTQKPKPYFSPASLIERSRRHLLRQAVMQPQHAVTAPGKLKVVGDYEGSEPVLAMQSLYQVKHHFCGPVVQIAGWLVGHQDFRSCYQRSGQSHPLLLAAG